MWTTRVPSFHPGRTHWGSQWPIAIPHTLKHFINFFSKTLSTENFFANRWKKPRARMLMLSGIWEELSSCIVWETPAVHPPAGNGSLCRVSMLPWQPSGAAHPMLEDGGNVGLPACLWGAVTVKSILTLVKLSLWEGKLWSLDPLAISWVIVHLLSLKLRISLEKWKKNKNKIETGMGFVCYEP